MRHACAYLILLTVVTGCGNPGGAADVESAEAAFSARKHVETLRLAPVEFQDRIELTGTVDAHDDVILTAQTDGVLRYLVPLGTQVRADETVAELDADLLQVAADQAEAELANAEATLRLAADTYARQEPLYADSIISASEFTRIEVELARAQNMVRQFTAIRDRAQRLLQDATLTAPFDARVEAHFLRPGEHAAPRTPVVRLVSLQDVRITIGVPERYVGDISLGMPAELDFEGLADSVWIGTVSFASSVIDPDNRTFAVEIVVNNLNYQLKPEMIVRVSMAHDLIPDALIVPRSAVSRDEESHYVYVVDTSGDDVRARRRDVVLGPSYSERRTVDSGLEIDELVVVRGQEIILDGDRVVVDHEYSMLSESGIPTDPAGG